MKTQKSRPAKKHNTLRHVIRVTDGLLVTIDGKRRTEVNYRSLRRLNTLAALEAAFLGMGFRLMKRAPDQIIYEKTIRHGANPVTKPCVVAGCDKPRMTNRKGKSLTMCEEHQREYWRSRHTPTGGKRGRPPKPTVPMLPAPIPVTAGLRIIALRCATCGIKHPYTDEYFDVVGKSRTCRHCASTLVVTIVDPISSTARRARLLIADEPVSCGEGAEAYAAFARAEKAAGHHVVIQW